MSAANDGRKMSGEEIQNCNLKYVVDAADDEPDPKRLKSIERTKAAKKRVKKIKTRMAQRAADYESQVQKDVRKFLASSLANYIVVPPQLFMNELYMNRPRYTCSLCSF